MGQPTMYLESYIHIIEYLKKTRNMDVRVFAVQYQMRPEVNYSTTKADIMNGYRYLIEDLKINSQKVVVGKDLHITLYTHMYSFNF
jgi:hypothetical protein